MLQIRKSATYRQHLALEQSLGRHQDARASFRQPRDDRIRPESREQRRVHTRVLERPKRRDVERRNASQQRRDHIALANAKGPQCIRKTACLPPQVPIRQILPFAVATEPADRNLADSASGGMAIDGFVSDV